MHTINVKWTKLFRQGFPHGMAGSLPRYIRCAITCLLYTSAVDGVQEATVDLEKKQAMVILLKDVPDQVLMDAVTEAGYTPVSCALA